MTSRGSSSGSHRPMPLGELLKRDVNVKVEKADVLFGQASQSRKGEDFTFIETDCQRATGDADTSFSVFTMVQKIRWMVRRVFLLMADDEGDDSDDCCRFSKDALTIKSSKRSPLMLKMIALTFVMICGIYISSISLKQLGFHPQSIFPVEVTKDSCPIPTVSQSELHSLHYPDPVSYRREECSCTPVRLFAILSMQRSGSGWFETLLNSHTNISSNGEIFSNKDRRSNITSITNTLDKVYNLDWLSSAAKNECTAAVGLKWMLNQGLLKNHEDIVAYFNRRSVSAIFLFRRNLLRRMVSVLANLHDRDAKLLNGTHRSHVHSKNEAVILAKHKPFVNTSLLVPELKRTEKMAADAVNYFKSTRHIILFYEDIVRNQTKLMDVLEFLSVPQRKLVSLQVKIHTRPLADQIDNWDSVYKKLKGTEYETFLNADYQL